VGDFKYLRARRLQFSLCQVERRQPVAVIAGAIATRQSP
jgi:hypothetical protein